MPDRDPLTRIFSDDRARDVQGESAYISSPVGDGTSVGNAVHDLIWSGTVSGRGMIFRIFGLLLLTLLVLVLVVLVPAMRSRPVVWSLVGVVTVGWIFFFLELRLRQLSRHYTFRRNTLEIARGLLSRNVTTIPFINVTGIELSQNVLERIFDVGAVDIAYTAFDHRQTLHLSGVAGIRTIYDRLNTRWQEIRRISSGV